MGDAVLTTESRVAFHRTVIFATLLGLGVVISVAWAGVLGYALFRLVASFF